jgi:hypothetical protein
MYKRLYPRADGNHQGDISMAKKNDDVSKIVKFFLEQVNKQYKIVAIQTLQGHICAWRGQIGFKAIFSKYVSGLVDGNAGELLV